MVRNLPLTSNRSSSGADSFSSLNIIWRKNQGTANCRGNDSWSWIFCKILEGLWVIAGWLNWCTVTLVSAKTTWCRAKTGCGGWSNKYWKEARHFSVVPILRYTHLHGFMVDGSSDDVGEQCVGLPSALFFCFPLVINYGGRRAATWN